MGRGKCLSEAEVALIEDGVGAGGSARAIYDKHTNPGRGAAKKNLVVQNGYAHRSKN